MSETTTPEPTEATPPPADGPLLDLTDAGVKKFIKQAKARGYVTSSARGPAHADVGEGVTAGGAGAGAPGGGGEERGVVRAEGGGGGGGGGEGAAGRDAAEGGVRKRGAPKRNTTRLPSRKIS